MSSNGLKQRKDELYLGKLVSAILLLDSLPDSARIPKTYLYTSTLAQPSPKLLNRTYTSEDKPDHRVPSFKEYPDGIETNNLQRYRNRRRSSTQVMTTSNEEHTGTSLPAASTNTMSNGTRSPRVSGRPPRYPTSGSVSRAVRALNREHQMESSELDFSIRQPFLASASPAPEGNSPRNSVHTGPHSSRAPHPNASFLASRRSSSTRAPRIRRASVRRVSSANEEQVDARLHRTGPNSDILNPDAFLRRGRELQGSQRRRSGSATASIASNSAINRSLRSSRIFNSNNDSLSPSVSNYETNLKNEQSRADRVDEESIAYQKSQKSTNY